ncbi:hypothetical protein BH11ACT3_BH11ACT3_03050 [soil metagenome]
MTSAFEIRPATADDGEAIVDAIIAAADWDGERGVSRAEIEKQYWFWKYGVDWMRQTDLGVVALVSGAPVGAAWVRYFAAEDAGFGYVHDDIPELTMGLHADHRGRGIGAALLSRLLTLAREVGIPAISLSVEDGNTRARTLYQRNGFVVVGRFGESDTMVRRLQGSESPFSPTVAVTKIGM